MSEQRIDVVEGMTCAGKTTCVMDIGAVHGVDMLLEHPPRLDFDPNDWLGHQRLVFEAYMEAFNKVDKDCFADFSPLACIPFTMACIDVGFIGETEGLSSVLSMMADCNRLLRRHRVFLHRYFSLPLADIKARLASRKRAGDDTWPPNLLAAIKERYDEFFEGENWLTRRKNGRIIAVHKPSYQNRR